jgi:hypothetical protein
MQTVQMGGFRRPYHLHAEIYGVIRRCGDQDELKLENLKIALENKRRAYAWAMGRRPFWGEVLTPPPLGAHTGARAPEQPS